MKVFVEICILISGCLAILEVKVLVEVSSFCLSNYFRKSVAERAKESSSYLHCFSTAFLMPLRGTPTWWLHTGLRKILQNTSTNI